MNDAVPLWLSKRVSNSGTPFSSASGDELTSTIPPSIVRPSSVDTPHLAFQTSCLASKVFSTSAMMELSDSAVPSRRSNLVHQPPAILSLWVPTRITVDWGPADKGR